MLNADAEPTIYVKNCNYAVIASGFYPLHNLEYLIGRANDEIKRSKMYGINENYILDYDFIARIQGKVSTYKGVMALDGDNTIVTHIYNVQKSVSEGKIGTLNDAIVLNDVPLEDSLEFVKNYLECHNYIGCLCEQYANEILECQSEITKNNSNVSKETNLIALQSVIDTFGDAIDRMNLHRKVINETSDFNKMLECGIGVNDKIIGKNTDTKVRPR